MWGLLSRPHLHESSSCGCGVLCAPPVFTVLAFSAAHQLQVERHLENGEKQWENGRKIGEKWGDIVTHVYKGTLAGAVSPSDLQFQSSFCCSQSWGLHPETETRSELRPVALLEPPNHHRKSDLTQVLQCHWSRNHLAYQELFKLFCLKTESESTSHSDTVTQNKPGYCDPQVLTSLLF